MTSLKWPPFLVVFRLPWLDDGLSAPSFRFPGDFEGNVKAAVN